MCLHLYAAAEHGSHSEMWSGFDFLESILKTICTSIYLSVVSLLANTSVRLLGSHCSREISMTKAWSSVVCSAPFHLFYKLQSPLVVCCCFFKPQHSLHAQSAAPKGCFSSLAFCSTSSMSTLCKHIRHTNIN